MRGEYGACNRTLKGVILGAIFVLCSARGARSGDLDDVRHAGKLRHLGIPYAQFVTENRSAGLDVELMQRFAAYLGVKYEFVETTWQNAIPDLTGKLVKPKGDDVGVIGSAPIRGDVVAAGFTVLPWRKKVVDFSLPTFPTGIWLVARADSTLQPISPTGDIGKDVAAVKASLKNKKVLGLADGCLDPSLYGLKATGARIEIFPADRNLEEMIPAVMGGAADATLMDVPVALVALEKWSGEIKVLGPISSAQTMACAFPKSSPKLRKAFDEFLEKCKKDGTYKALVRKYYPSVFGYYGKFFDS